MTLAISYPEPRVKSLAGAHIRGANLSNAKLIGTNLSRADLTGAILRGANFLDTNLKGTILNKADLTDAKNLTRKQIDEAIIDETTILPDYLK
jgi:uncharacterized protein YjbI with pentapeptide repeats